MNTKETNDEKLQRVWTEILDSTDMEMLSRICTAQKQESDNTKEN